ncbi:hypothetical protein [Streptomyces sp. MMG1121]|uniref:hypothetical protein n=1 Tax=Streptomyces sp. MMG1121 TaxID=1415544 RepID=UPI0006AE55FD|nr:hypothetical protein [Streptomyces sp. MMG1121]KOV62710.1 hypothetical protein ADK64_23390 [Streptomyces sp. MMG1121]
MSEGKAVPADDKLPEPGQSKLPLTPDELQKHHVIPGFEGLHTAPPASSTKDPLNMPTLQPDTPGLLRPPGQSGPPADIPGLLTPPGQSGQSRERLEIAPAVLNKAAGSVDDIHDDFYKPAASLEEPALKAVAALTEFESARAIRLAHRQWERQSGTVTAWLTHIAESLRSADSTYKKTDCAVGDTARQVQIRSALMDY